MCVTRHAQITQNKRLQFLCSILRKKWITKLIFCMQVSMKTYYQLIQWFWWGWWSISKVPKVASLHCIYKTSKKKLEIKFIFCMQINIKVACKFISTLWAPKFSTRWYYHYWWAWWSVLKVLKVKSLQIFAWSQKRSWEWSSFFACR